MTTSRQLAVRQLAARILGGLAVGALVGAAVLPLLRVGADTASCSVTASSYADSVLNPPRGEDTEFFVNSGGIPSLYFLVDTSKSMLRLPADGASLGWGSFQSNLGSGAVVGYGCVNATANALAYHSSCGQTTLDGKPYNQNAGAATMVAPPNFVTDASVSAGVYCPAMRSGNQAPVTNAAGYDPDFASFFAKDAVYHDTVGVGAWSSSDGWTSSAATATSTAASTFCSSGTLDADQQASCARCMNDYGYWFDGTYQATATGPSCANTAECQSHGFGTCITDSEKREHNGANDNNAHCRIPNVYFTGNFLNFYPPKFVIARKVLKDVLAETRRMRMGLAVLNGDTGAKNVWSLNPPCKQVNSPSSYDSNRSSLRTEIDKLTFDGNSAPLAEALLSVGQGHASLGTTPYWFGDAKFQYGLTDDSNAKQKAICFNCQATAVLLITGSKPTADAQIPSMTPAIDATLADPAKTAGSHAGIAYGITDISATTCPECNTAAEAADTAIPGGQCFGQQLSGACGSSNGVAASGIPSYLPKVAWYLRNMDFRVDTDDTADGFKMTGKQSLTTYVIGIGAKGNNADIFRHTALAGGGFYNGGRADDVLDASTLKDAILRVLDDVNARSTSFGAASLSTLQASASQGVLVPRFEPGRSAHWKGHLYAFDLYSEFTAAAPRDTPCRVPTDGSKSGPGNGDYDCDGRCTSVFLRDADGDFIQEDGSGAFKKNKDTKVAACGNGSSCKESEGTCSTASNLDAKPRWDAGDQLAPVKVTTAADGTQTTTVKDTSTFTAWSDRKVYTVYDSNSDGKFTSADTIVQLDPSDKSRYTSLVPYLNIDTRYCESLGSGLAQVGNTTAAAAIDADLKAGKLEACALVIGQYILGADIYNERKCADFPGSYCNRAYLLGDVFHSSPVEVWPPLPSDGYLCSRGLHPQCLASLYSSSITDTGVDHTHAYDDYAKKDVYRHRKKFALVGANDGMLHAFTTGVWKSADDDRTTPDESKAPYDGYHDDRDPAVGKELWAFVPPDLLPKLPLLLGTVHHFFVDGTPMVRDVWIDGGINGTITNKVGGTHDKDGKRQGGEFFTVAVIGERRGGTHYFALDVTDAPDNSGLNGKPRFLWLYPQPGDPEELQFGETYVEFVPKPPPIGPVRVDAGTSCAATAPHYKDRCFDERWVAFLSGGFDPQYTKGRGVHMVELATGDELWDFSAPPGPASDCDNTKDPRCHLQYPVAATVGMMMWGKQDNFLSAAAQDGYFDTATFGDTGGQLWVLRFNTPGTKGTNGKVDNWYGARVLQHAKASAQECGLNYCAGQPFFYITSNLPLQTNGYYRVLVGTGDRYNLLDPVGGVCGPDNIRACILKGCTVKLQDSAGAAGAVYGVSSLLGTDSYAMNHAATCSTVDTAGYSYSSTGGTTGGACTTVTAKIDGLQISCPSTVTCSTNAESVKKKMAVSCSGGVCAPAMGNDPGQFIDLKGNKDVKNWFFSVLVWNKGTDRAIFDDLEGAIRYDKARLSEADLTSVNDVDNKVSGAKLATADGNGWKYYFDHGDPNTANTTTISDGTYYIYRTDERTASTSAVEASCTFWNTMQTGLPPGAWDTAASGTDCPVNSPCKASRAQISYLYGASPSTGAVCLQVNGALERVQKNETLVPPHIGKLVAYVSSGQVSFGLTSVRIPQGGSNVALGDVQDIQSLVEWLPVPKGSHDCRHAPRDQAAPPCK